MNARSSIFIVGLAASGMAIAGCGGSSDADTATDVSTSATIDSATDTTEETVEETANEVVEETAESSVESATAPATESTSATFEESASAGDASNPTEPSGELAAELAAIDELGFCDGSWFSELSETNSGRPDGVVPLVDDWSCNTSEYQTALLGWSNEDDTRSSLAAVANFFAENDNDPASVDVLLKDSHFYIVASLESGQTSDLDALTQIQDKIGGELTSLAEFVN